MRIAVLRGGPSKYYDLSLKTGESVLSALRQDPRYSPIDVFVSKDGYWHVGGIAVEPDVALRHVDLVWNALHGEYGDDGKVRRYLSMMNIPSTGSEGLSLAAAHNKDVAKRIYSSHGILTPRYEVLMGDVSEDELIRIFREFLHPVIVKPVQGKKGVGAKVAQSFEELKHGVADAFKHAERIIIEEFIKGKDARCAVLENFRDKHFYTMLPDPPSFRSAVHTEIEKMAEAAHKALGLRHYSSSDFIITPKEKIYILETNALPELTPNSHLDRSLNNIGLSTKDFVHHVVSLAI